MMHLSHKEDTRPTRDEISMLRYLLKVTRTQIIDFHLGTNTCGDDSTSKRQAQLTAIHWATHPEKRLEVTVEQRRRRWAGDEKGEKVGERKIELLSLRDVCDVIPDANFDQAKEYFAKLAGSKSFAEKEAARTGHNARSVAAKKAWTRKL
jgi:hypothetical protein